MQRYRTLACIEWRCNRCGEDVMADEQGFGKCGCTESPSPWEHVRCLNGDGSSEFVLFRREPGQER